MKNVYNDNDNDNGNKKKLGQFSNELMTVKPFNT